MKTLAAVLLGILFAFSNTSCKHDPMVVDYTDTICFSRDIYPIFSNSCGIAGCHDGGGEDFDATSYEGIMRAITPGNANKSKAYNAITSVYINPMPPSGPLSKEQRTLIALWINQGAPNSTCPDNTPSIPGDPTSVNPQNDSVCFAQSILPVLQSSCAVARCHDPITHEEGYDFTSYSSVMNGERAVVPFSPSQSKIYRSITTASGENRMPPYPRSSLTTSDINNFNKWISQGALNSDCPSGTCDTLNAISYSTQIYPLLQRNCLGCHNTTLASANVDLSSYQKVVYYAENGINGTPYLIGVINHLSGFFPMPQYGMLDNCSIRTIELWIDQGKQNN